MFRMGGDEFLIILPKTNEEQTQNYVEALKLAAQKINIKGLPLSISYGIYTMNDTDEDVMNAVKIADKNMYGEKERKKRCR